MSKYKDLTENYKNRARMKVIGLKDCTIEEKEEFILLTFLGSRKQEIQIQYFINLLKEQIIKKCNHVRIKYYPNARLSAGRIYVENYYTHEILHRTENKHLAQYYCNENNLKVLKTELDGYEGSLDESGL